MRQWLLLSLIFLILPACQSKPIRQFEKIKPGMEKVEVLDLMGSPTAVTRFHGKDRWIYIFYDKDARQEKEIHFEGGSAVYVGGAWQPAPEKTAEKRDQQNLEMEKQLKEENARQKEENKNAYSNYEKEVKGEGKKIKYMPEYSEIK